MNHIMVVNKKLIQESRGDGMKTDEDHYENVVGIDNDAEHGDADRDDSDTRILGNSIFLGCKLFLCQSFFLALQPLKSSFPSSLTIHLDTLLLF